MEKTSLSTKAPDDGRPASVPLGEVTVLHSSVNKLPQSINTHDIEILRPSVLGNPFLMSKESDRPK
eukprot:5852911-Karenia_brevis.AAC.1